MSRIESRTRSLARESEEMQSAIKTVLDRAEEGEIKWVDVKDEMSSGEWGRLIEQGLLVDGEEGFELEDPDAVREGLESQVDFDFELEFDDVETTKWTKWDKGAAAFTVLLFVGYAYQPVREVIGTAVHLVFGPINAVLPFYVVIMLVALITGLYSTLLRVALIDTEKLGIYRERMSKVSDARKKAKAEGDDEQVEAIQEKQMEMMGDQLGMMKEQFRPMVWIMFVTIPLFLWMFWLVGFRGGEAQQEFLNIVLPFAGEVTWTTGIVGPIQVWIVWYFLCSMAFTQVIQKGLNVKMTPS